MGRRRGHQGRVDANQQSIIEALTRLGVSVCSLAATGDGVPDLLLGYVAKSGPKAAVAEVKTEKGQLTPDQTKWRCWWIGPFVVFRSVDDARAWYQSERNK